MTQLHILGSGRISVPELSALGASSATDLEVARWAEKPARLARMDRLCALALVACDAALVDAGLSPADASWVGERTGVVLGSAFGSHATNEAYYASYRSADGASPRLFAYTLPSSPVGEISIHHRILGPSSTTISGLVAGLDALREALRHLDAGRADRVLVAAADVATPMLRRLGYDLSVDQAAAVVLDRSAGAYALHAASRFVAGDLLAATQLVLRQLPSTPVDHLYAPVSVLAALQAGFPTATSSPLAASAVAPIEAVASFSQSTARTALVVAADPCGQVSALRLDRLA